MATKKKAGSKKGSSQIEALVANDPPIVVSGGGGGDFPHTIRKPAKNIVEVGFTPQSGLTHRRFPTRVNRAPEIISVEITFPGMVGARPVTLSNYEFYRIEIKFITEDEPPRPVKRGAKASRKGKTSGKRPTPRKRK